MGLDTAISSKLHYIKSIRRSYGEDTFELTGGSPCLSFLGATDSICKDRGGRQDHPQHFCTCSCNRSARTYSIFYDTCISQNSGGGSVFTTGTFQKSYGYVRTRRIDALMKKGFLIYYCQPGGDNCSKNMRTCHIIKEQSYIDGHQMELLFTKNRREDFYLKDSQDDSMTFLASQHADKEFYTGKLLNISLECQQIHTKTKIRSFLLVKIQGTFLVPSPFTTKTTEILNTQYTSRHTLPIVQPSIPFVVPSTTTPYRTNKTKLLIATTYRRSSTVFDGVVMNATSPSKTSNENSKASSFLSVSSVDNGNPKSTSIKFFPTFSTSADPRNIISTSSYNHTVSSTDARRRNGLIFFDTFSSLTLSSSIHLIVLKNERRISHGSNKRVPVIFVSFGGGCIFMFMLIFLILLMKRKRKRKLQKKRERPSVYEIPFDVDAPQPNQQNRDLYDTLSIRYSELEPSYQSINNIEEVEIKSSEIYIKPMTNVNKLCKRTNKINLGYQESDESVVIDDEMTSDYLNPNDINVYQAHIYQTIGKGLKTEFVEGQN